MSATAVAPVRLVSIGKRYSGTKALDDVSVEVAGGTVHALVGANGAGKSTLGKIVGGVIRPDDGQLFVDDRPVRYASPREARIDGIATIAQELSPVPQMSVIENVFLGIEPRRSGVVQRRQMRTQYEKLISQWGFELNGHAKVGALRTADKQKVEILRAVACEARVIVMDEPTSSLTSVEIERLHRMIRALRASGRTIVYVSHFLDEVLDLADTVTVLRSGRLVRTGAGRPGDRGDPRRRHVRRRRGRRSTSRSRRARPHRWCWRCPVCTARACSGTSRCRSGPVRSSASPAWWAAAAPSSPARSPAPIRSMAARSPSTARPRRIRSPADAMAAGMAFLPESRKDDGLFMELSLASNTTFADLRAVASRFGVLRRALERSKTRALLNSLSVDPPNPSMRVANLSGGNQQKVLFARWLFRNPRVLILDEPTRGVDVAARAAIHRLINDLAAEGTAVLLISSEIEEVLGLAHRVLVMRLGSITREFGADPPLDAVMEAAFGLGGSTTA